MSTPTEQAYTELQHAYDFFNTWLFDGQLPPCLITLQRKNRTYGYFSGERWNDQAGTVTDEIALNPVHFATRSTAEVLSTLVHEMVHLWQHHCGTPSRSAYHNKEWAAKMDAIGLTPSDTGTPAGKRTGQHMSHYVLAGGAYAQACAQLLAQGFVISWRDRARADVSGKGKTPGKAGVRTKYTCPDCGLNAWAKSEVVLLCGACEVALEPEEACEAVALTHRTEGLSLCDAREDEAWRREWTASTQNSHDEGSIPDEKRRLSMVLRTGSPGLTRKN